MSTLFEFFFKYRPLVFQRGQIALQPPWPWYVTVLLILVAIGGSYLIYQRASGSLNGRWRGTLIALRALALLVLLFIFLQPVLTVHTVIPQKSFVAVAYDLSKSMEIRDGAEGQSRLEVVKHLLRPAGNSMLDELGRKFKLRFFRFSNSAQRVGGFEDLPRHGNVTDLDRTLSHIAGELGSAPVAGVVLITDGADNRFGDLSKTAAQLRARNIPVYPVGIGASDFKRDTEITRVSTPKKVLKDAMIEADVSVRSAGYAGRHAKLVVKERDRVIRSQEITLGSDGEVRTHKVNFSSETVGPKVFSFRIEPFSDEVVSENNDQDVLLRVENEQPKILYVEGEPRWEYGKLRSAIQGDKNLHLRTLLRQAEGKFYRQGVEDSATLEKGFPSDKAELFEYKGLILGSIEASFFTFDQLRLISDFVGQRGGGFLMLGGRNSFGQGGFVNTPLEEVLPVNIRFEGGKTAVPEYHDLEYKIRLTSYGSMHPITRLSLAEADNRKRWDAVPALVGLNPTLGAKPGATVLAQAQSDSRRDSPVLLAFQRYGKGKSVSLATASTWRWRMELDHRDNTHELFWKQMLRWLVSDAPDPVNAQADKHSYSLEEGVAIRAEVADKTFSPVNNARVSAQVKSPSGQLSTVTLTWSVNREGQYSGFFKPQEDGIYEISTEAFQGDKSLGAAKANFRVAESTDEYHNAALNVDLLRRLASETKGRYYSPRDTRTLPEDISYIDNGASRIEEKDLWDMPILFFLLVGFVSTEWILRKRKGLA
jgi:uncharacterized membrane protein